MIFRNGKIYPSTGARDKFEAELPFSFPESHASNLAALENGDLLCVWFSGSGEGNPDTNIIMSRLNKGSDTWGEPVLLSNDAERSEQNPVIFPAPDGKLWLFHTSNTPHDQKTSRICCRISGDNGYTWGDMKVIIDKEGTFIRHPPVVLDTGEWLLPAYECVPDDVMGHSGSHYSLVYISPDAGKSWKGHVIPNSAGRVHMSAVKLKDGSLFAVFRSRFSDRIYSSTSKSGGRDWTEPAPTSLPNNNSSIQMVRLMSGNLAIIFNNSGNLESTGKAVWGTPRTPLSVALSDDEGKTWAYRKDLQVADEDFKTARAREYSYPSILQTPDGWVHATYTFLRRFIKYQRFPEDWIRR